MYMVMLVLDDPSRLDAVLDAWQGSESRRHDSLGLIGNLARVERRLG